MDVVVRPIVGDEWRIWRELRMRATRDSPDSFRETVDDDLARSDEWWEELLRTAAEHPRSILLVADIEGRPVGILFSRVDAEFTYADVGAMWVDPEARGAGVGSALLDFAMVWALELGAPRMTLWVTDGNTGAEALYASRGFAPTGETGLLREGSSLTISELGVDLSRAGH